MSLSVLTLSACGDFRSSVDGDPFDPIGQIDVVLSAVGRREDWRPSNIVIRYRFAASFWGGEHNGFRLNDCNKQFCEWSRR